MQKKTHNETVTFNYNKAMEMINHGVANKTLQEKDGKIMVIHGFKKRWVDKKQMAKQIANNRKMMSWLKSIVQFTDNATAIAENDEKNGTVTEISMKSIPKPGDVEDAAQE